MHGALQVAAQQYLNKHIVSNFQCIKESFDFLVRTEEESIFEQKKNICW